MAQLTPAGPAAPQAAPVKRKSNILAYFSKPAPAAADADVSPGYPEPASKKTRTDTSTATDAPPAAAAAANTTADDDVFHDADDVDVPDRHKSG
jgi:hypothetical protein